MAIREHRVGFTDSGWALAKEVAEQEGMSIAQLVREATAVYAAYLAGKQTGDLKAAVESVVERLRDNK